VADAREALSPQQIMNLFKTLTLLNGQLMTRVIALEELLLEAGLVTPQQIASRRHSVAAQIVPQWLQSMQEAMTVADLHRRVESLLQAYTGPVQ